MKSKNIAKNTSYFTLALVLQKIVSFAYFTFLARVLGPEDLGKYFFAISFVAIFGIFIDIGMANVLVREVSKKPTDSSELLGNVFAIKLPLTIVSLSIIFFLINILHYSLLVKQLVIVASLALVFDSFTNSMYGIMRAHHIMIYESIASFTYQIVVFCFGFLFVLKGFDIRFIMMSLLAASILNFVFAGSLLKFKWKIKIKLVYSWAVIKSLLLLTAPFGLFAIFQKMYTYFDTILLNYYSGDRYVGLYQVAFKIVFALQFLPMAFTATLYPAMSSYWKENRDQLSVTFERAINYLMIISVPISLGIASLSDAIIFIFKDNYTEAILPLQIIIFSLPFIFVNYPLGSLLNACDKQKANTVNMLAVLVASVSLNFILIPKYNIIGASVTVLLTNFLMFVFGMYQAAKIVKIRFSKIFLLFFKVLSSAFAMGVFVVLLKGSLNIVFTVLLSATIYFILLFLMKAIRREDVLSVYNSFIKQ